MHTTGPHTMDTQGFGVDTVDYETALPDLRTVRETVFVQEQRVPLELEWDALDPQCVHVLARDAAGQPIGTGRLTPEHKIGRMAVLAPWRGRGVGDALLLALLAAARERGWREVSLHAQVSAQDFYARHGFLPLGERFEEAGIGHQTMRLLLDAANPVESREAAVARHSPPAPRCTADRPGPAPAQRVCVPRDRGAGRPRVPVGLPRQRRRRLPVPVPGPPLRRRDPAGCARAGAAVARHVR